MKIGNRKIVFTEYIIVLLFLLALLLESTITRLPLSLVLLLIFFVHRKSSGIFIMAFFLGMLVDILTVRRVGMSSLFFVVFIFLVYLYDRKYEIDTMQFAMIATAVASTIYISLYSSNNLFLQVIVCTAMGGLTFSIFKLLRI
jgi:cell shape-determining protein MreD